MICCHNYCSACKQPDNESRAKLNVDSFFVSKRTTDSTSLDHFQRLHHDDSRVAFLWHCGRLLRGISCGACPRAGHIGNVNGVNSAVICQRKPLGEFSSQLHSSNQRDRSPIQQDRGTVRQDGEGLPQNRLKVRAAEPDVKINPQNRAIDEAMIAADRKSTQSERRDLIHSEQQRRVDRQNVRQDWTQRKVSQPGASGPSGAGHISGGFFGNGNGSSNPSAVGDTAPLLRRSPNRTR